MPRDEEKYQDFISEILEKFANILTPELMLLDELNPEIRNLKEIMNSEDFKNKKILNKLTILFKENHKDQHLQ